MDMFESNRLKHLEKSSPLAARMRPKTLDQFSGQSHFLGPGRLLHRAIKIDQLSFHLTPVHHQRTPEELLIGHHLMFVNHMKIIIFISKYSLVLFKSQ